MNTININRIININQFKLFWPKLSLIRAKIQNNAPMRLYSIITYAIYSQTEINNAINPMYKYNDKTKNKYFHSLHDDIKFFLHTITVIRFN